jgi:hypothetical protein
MRLMFVHPVWEDRGSPQDIFHYTRVAKEMGHEVVLFGSPKVPTPFSYTTDVSNVAAAIFVFETTTKLQYGNNLLDWPRLLSSVPRARRAVIDCDGNYNDSISVDGDFNTWGSPKEQRVWTETCDSLSDTILQPTYRPLRSNVRPFFFHGYSPSWEVPLNFENKEFGMVYVGNNWFRWRSLHRVLQIIEAIREHIGRIVLVGAGWDKVAEWGTDSFPQGFGRDPEYLKQHGVEVVPPVRFDNVVSWMSRGLFNPVIYRPLFDHLQLVTCRTFETVAANTLPLFCQKPEFVSDVYGSAALELVLPNHHPADKIRDLFERPQHYAQVVRELRNVLAQRYSYAARFRELLQILDIGS